VYLAAILFVAAWGVLQWLMLKLGLPYPSYIFNNSSTESAQGFATFLAPEVPRISSVAVEPSILAQVLLTVLPFVVFTGVLRFPVISKQFNRSLLILIIGVLLLSTSFSAYLGSGIVMIAIVIAFYRSKTLRLRHVLLIFLTLSIILLACLTVPSVTEFVNSQLLTKSDSYSGVERVRTVILAFGYFTESPWLGLGWGSVTSHDLVINILSNVGLVGLCSFLTFVVILWRRLRVSIHNSFFAEEKCLKIAIALSLITLLLMNVFTGVSFFFGHFWLTVGLAMGATAIKYDKPKLVVENALSDEK
jgi:O-antigen ligase